MRSIERSKPGLTWTRCARWSAKGLTARYCRCDQPARLMARDWLTLRGSRPSLWHQKHTAISRLPLASCSDRLLTERRGSPLDGKGGADSRADPAADSYP